jgi:hypothetical protein
MVFSIGSGPRATQYPAVAADQGQRNELDRLSTTLLPTETRLSMGDLREEAADALRAQATVRWPFGHLAKSTVRNLELRRGLRGEGRGARFERILDGP